MSVSTATRLVGSSLIIASRIESLIWSAILSGWPSVTDSDVNKRRAKRCSERVLTGRAESRRLAGQARRDGVAQHRGENGLRAERDREFAAVGTEDDRGVV